MPGSHVVYAKNPDLYGVMEIEMPLTDGRLSCRSLASDDMFEFHPQELDLAPGSKTQ